MFFDPSGKMAAEATLVATNWWNPIGWIAATVLVVEVVVLVVVTVEAIDSFNNNHTINVEQANARNPNPPAKRHRNNSKKKAYERAKRAGKGKEPNHDYDGRYGPHYHPNVEMPKSPTPKAPNPHDHYYYPK